MFDWEMLALRTGGGSGGSRRDEAGVCLCLHMLICMCYLWKSMKIEENVINVFFCLLLVPLFLSPFARWCRRRRRRETRREYSGGDWYISNVKADNAEPLEINEESD